VPKVKLPDGKVLEVPQGATALDAAKAIGPRLAQAAIACKIDGVVRDLSTPITHDIEFQVLTWKDQEGKDALRHSVAHLLAAAVVELWPNTKRTIGPAIENGFYYDFEFEKPISDKDLPAIEQKMREILPSWDKFTRSELSEQEALKQFANNPFKQELIREFSQGGKKVSFYASGKYSDLCRGGHVSSMKMIPADSFKLTHLAGAYWRGSEKNPQLTRIYGVAFSSKKELDDYLAKLEEAEKRDHRKIGKELGLFMFHETAPGIPYWLPNGVVMLNELVNFWRQEHESRGYKEIASPLVNKKELWEISGHWEHYKDSMFIADMGENDVYGIKPMNCPNAMIVFGSQTRSYRELPLRLSDTDMLHRYELSGTLGGLLRVRSFRQDDSHNFVMPEQIEEEYARIFEITKLFYEVFGLEYHYRIGTRPKGFLGHVEDWDRAEAALKNILEQKVGKGNYLIAEGDGAFYGPKIDILMRDALGREWQTGTIQLDFQLPKRFNLKYIDKDNNEKTPVVVHRVIYGSLERFIGILIEHYAGAFPTWIAPIQAVVLPIAEGQNDYALEVQQKLKAAGIRTEIDLRNERLEPKVRDWQMKKPPYVLVVGKKEQETNTLSIRRRDNSVTQGVPVQKFLGDVVSEIRDKKR
jgi:threonyl-tRNA synthetase